MVVAFSYYDWCDYRHSFIIIHVNYSYRIRNVLLFNTRASIFCLPQLLDRTAYFIETKSNDLAKQIYVLPELFSHIRNGEN